MLSSPFQQIRESVCSRLACFKRGSPDSFSVHVVMDSCAGKVTVFEGSSVFLGAPGAGCSEAFIPHHPCGKFAEVSNSWPSPNSAQSDPPASTETGNSCDSLWLCPNSRLFRRSQDKFGFDVYITPGARHHGPAYLFECPAVLPWMELVIALAAEAGRPQKDVILSSKFYPDVVHDEISYEAWLAWSRNQDGPCSTDLWLVE